MGEDKKELMLRLSSIIVNDRFCMIDVTQAEHDSFVDKVADIYVKLCKIEGEQVLLL